MFYIKYFFFFLFFLSSCQNSQDNKLLSQLIGSTIGAVIGSKVGSESTKSLMILLGSTTGYLIGGKISNILSEKDKLELNESIKETLDKNEVDETSEWKSSSEPSLSAKITPKIDFTAENKSCREFEKIINKDDDSYSIKSKACRDENDNWVIFES